MVSDIPKWYKELAEGMIDLHIHASPCMYERIGDEIDIARQAQEFGYRGILFKCHHTLNADRAFLIRKVLPGMEIHGGLVLSHFVGGLNPDAVEAAIISGAKAIWMPVLHSTHHLKIGRPSLKPIVEVKRQRKVWRGITLLNGSGGLFPEVQEILEMIADADMILGTGHISIEEIFLLIEAAKKAHVKKILVTHVDHPCTKWSVEDQVKMAEMGAVLEHCPADLDLVAKAVTAVGAKRCVMATDGGLASKLPPVEIMRNFVEGILTRSLTEKDIEVMTKENPCRLLNLT